MPTDQPSTDGPASPPDDETPGNGIPAEEVPVGEIPADEIPAAVPGESRVHETNGVRLHVVEAGPADGKLLVLLHGFPEFWYGWHAAIEPLAAAGFRVVVPDQRGYNLSEKPDGIAPYRIDELARDVAGLIDAYDRETAVLAGHDWGAAVGWWIALHHPDRLRRFVAVNLPHPTVFRRTLQSSWRQRLRSWYILAFQFPWAPERIARVRNWAPIVEGMRRSSRPGTFDAEDFDRYRRAWDRPGAFTGMVNWYRAVGRERPTPTHTIVNVPTRIVWGAGDRFLQRSMAVESLAHCSSGTLQTVHDATHWILHEHPNRVARAIREHIE